MKRIFSLIFLSLLIVSATLAQDYSGEQGSMRMRHNQTSAGINISLWRNISTQRIDTTGSTWLNLGVFSSMNRLNGLGINMLGSIVRKEANGIQVAGLSNMVGGKMRGIQVAGITNINGSLSGISVSGLVGITGNNAQGLTLSGLATINGNHSRGISIGGLLNINGNAAAGAQLAGLANVSGGSLKGFTGAGLLNIVGEHLNGAQLSVLANIIAGNMVGIQFSGIGNVVGGTAKGVQIGAANMTVHAKGVQIGLFNYYKNSLDGFQLGLVNANPQTKVQLMLFAGNATKLNAGARFKNKLFYTILGGGTHYMDFGDKFSAALFYRAGLELPLYKQLFISGDLGYQHIETFKNKNDEIPARLYALQARVNLEYRLHDGLGIFLTGGYGSSRHYTRNKCYDKGVIVEAGVVLF